MMTICWNNHEMEYLQDDVNCRVCGENSQHVTRRWGPGEKEALDKLAQEIRDRPNPEFHYQRGYQKGFEEGIKAEKSRNKE